MQSVYAKRASRGLTLLELVAVLAILAALAAMVIPRLDFLKSQSEHATAAATMGDLASILQTQKVAGKSYPTFDLLVDENGDLFSKLWSYPGGAPFTAETIDGVTGPAGPFWYQSFLNGGLLNGYTLDSTATNASNASSSGTATDLVNGAAGGDLVVAALNTTGSDFYAGKLVDTIYPDGVPTGAKLIAMGVGPRSVGAGSLLTSAPMDAQQGDDPASVYSRYIAIFAIYQDGTPAQLKMVVDHRLKMVGDRIDQFNQVAPSVTQ